MTLPTQTEMLERLLPADLSKAFNATHARKQASLLVASSCRGVPRRPQRGQGQPTSLPWLPCVVLLKFYVGWNMLM